tara:strand:+ start:1112 stop:1396 length:285 start_codon:yes stop_codon:yes gene_type:complete
MIEAQNNDQINDENGNSTKTAVMVSSLFDENGKCINDKETYFDEEGDLIEWILISNEYDKFPVKSDIVKMHYAENYAGETHGNYCARTLFFRGY